MSERWTIGELSVRYELEPTLKDIFVEGAFDRDILSNCFRSMKDDSRKAYEIQTVEVPNELVASHGLSSGNKQRVITLARELANLPAACSYKCFVDRDLDHWFGELEDTARLTWTEFSSIELHFFSDEVLQDVILTTAKSKIDNWNQYKDSLIVVLRNLFALRLADRELGLNLKWLPFEKYLSKEGSQIAFDLSTYMDRLLIKNGEMGLKNRYEELLGGWLLKLNGDCRNYIRGHDLVDMIAWTVKEFRGVKEFSEADVIQRLFVLLAPRVPNIVGTL